MTSRAVVYHRPRRRSRVPAVLAGLLGLTGLVAAQLAVAGTLTVPGLPGVGGPSGDQEPVAVGPTVAASVAPAPGAVPASTPAAPVPAATEGSSGAGLRPVPTTTVRFAAGAVLDEQARADLEPVLAVLASPDAAPVLLTGTAEPGTDTTSSLRLAQLRADAVAEALVEGGAPAALLRTTGVVDPDGGRSVVLVAEVP